jgi:hypothetical protein
MRTPLSRSKLYLATTLLGCAGLVTPFLQFAYGESPLSVITEAFQGVLLGLPFFLAIPISAASLRWMFLGQPARWELGITFGSALITGLGILAPMVRLVYEPFSFSPGEWVVLALPLSILALASVYIWRRWRSRMPAAQTAAAAMQFAYCANALLCLAGFWKERQIGAYVTLFTVVIYALQLLLQLRTESESA